MVKLSDLKVGSQVRALSTSDGMGDTYAGTLVIGRVYNVCEVITDDADDIQPVAITVPNDPLFDDGFWVTLANIELVQEKDA